jgi:hypothetical protein
MSGSSAGPLPSTGAGWERTTTSRGFGSAVPATTHTAFRSLVASSDAGSRLRSDATAPARPVEPSAYRIIDSTRRPSGIGVPSLSTTCHSPNRSSRYRPTRPVDSIGSPRWTSHNRYPSAGSVGRSAERRSSAPSATTPLIPSPGPRRSSTESTPRSEGRSHPARTGQSVGFSRRTTIRLVVIMTAVFGIEVGSTILRRIVREDVPVRVVPNRNSACSTTGCGNIELVDVARLWISAPVDVGEHPRRAHAGGDAGVPLRLVEGTVPARTGW